MYNLLANWGRPFPSLIDAEKLGFLQPDGKNKYYTLQPAGIIGNSPHVCAFLSL